MEVNYEQLPAREEGKTPGHKSDGESQLDPYEPSFRPQVYTGDAITTDPTSYPAQGHPNPMYPNPYPYPAPYYGQQEQSTTNTTVVVQQGSQAKEPREWSSRLCECGKEWSICCCGLFCECYLRQRVALDMAESSMLPCCVPGWLTVLRTKMRIHENITGSVMNDCCNTFWCSSCALCQLAYEIKVVRERDRALGTQLNVI
jgi:Cys-rich protein (TIGR01571 family)